MTQLELVNYDFGQKTREELAPGVRINMSSQHLYISAMNPLLMIRFWSNFWDCIYFLCSNQNHNPLCDFDFIRILYLHCWYDATCSSKMMDQVSSKRYIVHPNNFFPKYWIYVFSGRPTQYHMCRHISAKLCLRSM